MTDYTRDYYGSARGNGSHDGSAAELTQNMQNIMTGSNVQDNLQSLVESIQKVQFIKNCVIFNMTYIYM